MNESRGNWSSNIGFLIAAVGSAVGLGNIWGFPYKMGENGGFAFLIIYLILAAVVGFAIMISELAIGRKTGKGVLGAYKDFKKGFGWVGMIGIIVPFIILFFYTVLGAYCLEYMFINLANLAFGQISDLSGPDLFGKMLTNQLGSVIYLFFFLAICFVIVKSGIKNGIEKFNKYAMPALALMLLIIIIRSVTLDGAKAGLEYMFTPNFEPLKENFVQVLAAASGQMFFSLSLAMGIIVTYGSYLSKQENIVKNATIIIIFDTIVALMAGLAVIPAAFALGGEDPALGGPGLLFKTLQNVFNEMGSVGPLFGTIFYFLVVIAAVTSTISLIEVLVTMYTDSRIKKGKKPKRMKATFVTCFLIFLGGCLVAIDGLGSNGIWVPFQEKFGVKPFNDCWLDFLDFISEGILMPFGALMTAIIVGWVAGSKKIREEVEAEGNLFYGYGFFKFCIKFITPIVMIFILFGQIDTFLDLGIIRNINSKVVVCSGDNLQFDNTYKVYLKDSEYGDIFIRKEKDNYCIKSKFIKLGNTDLIIESPTGEKWIYEIKIEKDSIILGEENKNL